MPALSWEILTVHTTVPFVIARGGASDHRVVKVTLRDTDGVTGWGEASPNRFYGETPETAVAALERLKPIIETQEVTPLRARNPQVVDDLRQVILGSRSRPAPVAQMRK